MGGPLRLVGRVVSNQEMQRTAKVLVTRAMRHPRTDKLMKKRKQYLVHDEADSLLAGDVVSIRQCRPLSRTKTFTLNEVLHRAERHVNPATGKVETKYNS